LRLALYAEKILYNTAVDYSGPVLSSAQFNREGNNVNSKLLFLHGEGGFDFKNADNCTSCCNTKNNLFYFVSEQNRYYQTNPTIQQDHIVLTSIVPSNEKIRSIRQHWNSFQECVIINKRSKISSPSHLLEVNN